MGARSDISNNVFDTGTVRFVDGELQEASFLRQSTAKS